MIARMTDVEYRHAAPHSGNAFYLLTQERLRAALVMRLEFDLDSERPFLLADWLRDSRAAGFSWEALARQLYQLTGCEVTSNTVKVWRAVAPTLPAPVPRPGV